MNQMDHNVKIKDYKRATKPSPFVSSSQKLSRPPLFSTNLEQEKMLERFQKLHWETDKLTGFSTADKMFILRQEQEQVEAFQRQQRFDVENHRLNHLQGIKDNIQTTRETFYNRTQLEHPEAVKRKLGKTPLYKIVNDGTLESFGGDV